MDPLPAAIGPFSESHATAERDQEGPLAKSATKEITSLWFDIVILEFQLTPKKIFLPFI